MLRPLSFVLISAAACGSPLTDNRWTRRGPTTQHLIRVDSGPRVTVLHHGGWHGLCANSLAQDRDGTFYVGIRHFVVRLRATHAGYHEDWLVPSGTRVQTTTAALARFFVGLWSELSDPFVGPAIRAEAGATYVTTVTSATAVATALVLCGAYRAFFQARRK